jgi:hypothetical protein
VNQRFEFDEWAKDLARGVSRREALRRLGGGLVGALLASLGLERAWGAPNPCSTFCNSLRHPAQRKNCNNACKQCGDNVQNVCASRNSDKVACCDRGACCINGQCTPTDLASNENCGACGNRCTGGTICVSGTCQCPSGQAVCPGGTTCCPITQACCNGVCCNVGEACDGGSCVRVAKTCSVAGCTAGVGKISCSATNSSCGCYATTEGVNLCLEPGPCNSGNACTSSADCPAGSFCGVTECCAGEGSICMSAGPCLT